MKRILVGALVAGTLLLAGCGSSNTASNTTTTVAQASSGDAKSSTTAGGSGDAKSSTTKAGGSDSGKTTDTVGMMECANVAMANLALMGGGDKAKEAVTTLEKYNPPADVTEAMNYLADNGGVSITDEKSADMLQKMSDWMESICPK